MHTILPGRRPHVLVLQCLQVWKEELDDLTTLSDFEDSSDEDHESESVTDEASTSRLARSCTLDTFEGKRVCRAVLYIQMQLAELTLRVWLQAERRGASLEVNRPYFVQMLSGLQHIHKSSLIHRDLTPANVFIASDKVFVYLSFLLPSSALAPPIPVWY